MRALILAVAVFAIAAPALAQVDEAIVVTGTRLQRYNELELPHITMKHRADSVIVDLIVRSDTRDYSDRLNEIRQALRNLDSRAAGANVSLALVDDAQDLVRPFTMAAAEELITSDSRPDTSMLTIHVRTPVSADDTLESIHARINRFVQQAPKPGRVELNTGDTQLVLNNPEQYRDPLLHLIAADSQSITGAMGQGYGVMLSGLERQVAWRRTGDLELTLFVPYNLSATPRA